MRAEGGRVQPTDRFSVLRRQLPFTVVTILAALAALTWAPWTFGQGRLVAPLVCALTATLVAAVVPWPKLPRSAAMSVPLLNLFAVMLAEIAELPAGALILLPVLVLARSGKHGLMLAIVAGVATSWVPALLRPDPLNLAIDDKLVDLVLRPTVVVTAAIVLFAAERRSAARAALLAGQSALVEELLQDTRADRELLETVLDTITTNVVVIDHAGVIQIVNRATATAHGATLVPGRKVQDIAVPLLAFDARTEIPASETPLVRAARGERFEGEVFWVRLPGGDRAAYRVSAAPLGGASGSVLAMENFTRELRALADREEFISAVSHELRTPLTSVLGYLELTLDDPGLSASARHQLEIASRNAHRLQILIENLLTAGGAEEAAWEPVNLSAVVQEVVEDEGPRADDARVTMTVAGPEQCMVMGDRNLITQMVDNLVSNAIKYSLPGGEVAITLTRPGGDGTPAGQDSVRLEVRDRGHGIPEDELPLVFDRFYRARSARQSTVQGTGLGLPITRRVVERLGGTIELHSTVGKGTRVIVDLPAGRDRQEAPPP